MGGKASRWDRAAPRFYAAVLAAMLVTNLLVFIRYQDPDVKVPHSIGYRPLAPHPAGWVDTDSGANQENFKHFLRLQDFLRGRRVMVPEPASKRQPWHWTHVALARVEGYPRDRRMRRPLDPRARSARTIELRHIRVLLPRDATRSRHDPWRPDEPAERVYLVPDGERAGAFHLVHEDDLERATFQVVRGRRRP